MARGQSNAEVPSPDAGRPAGGSRRRQGELIVGGRELPPHDVTDLSLTAQGDDRVEWASSRMPVLAMVASRFAAERPLAGVRVGACLHVTAETANLLRTLIAGGADVSVCASNPLSTKDDVAAALVAVDGVATFARHGETPAVYAAHLDAVLDRRPALTVDDGCDLIARLHLERPEQAAELIGGTEDTTTGALRLRAIAASGALAYPVVAVSGAETRRLADNRYGTGQSTMDGIMRATNILIAGTTAVVAGYGNCGRGIAERARGLGANVIVTEIDPLRALEAVLDGYRVMPMSQAVGEGQIFLTATGNRDVIRREHFAVMRDGAVLANAGNFDAEIDVTGLFELATLYRRQVRPMVDEFVLSDGTGSSRRILLLAEGRLVNLAVAEGHPPQVMDLAFAVQALACEWLVRRHAELEPVLHEVPDEIDAAVAGMKLATMCIAVDELSLAQKAYLASWTGQ